MAHLTHRGSDKHVLRKLHTLKEADKVTLRRELMTAKPFLTEVAVNIGLNSLVNKQYAECSGGVFSLTRAGLDAYNQIEGLN